MSLESMANPVAMEPYICILALGHSISLSKLVLTRICLLHLSFDPSEHACPLRLDARQLEFEFLLQLVYLLIELEIELLFPHLHLVHLHVLILSQVRHLAASTATTASRPEILIHTMMMLCRSVTLECQLSQERLQQGRVVVRMGVVVHAVVRALMVLQGRWYKRSTSARIKAW